jgi:hypothetical protein
MISITNFGKISPKISRKFLERGAARCPTRREITRDNEEKREYEEM